MGQDKWWAVAKAAGYEPPVYDIKRLNDAFIEVDVMSTFYSTILEQVLKKKQEGKTAREAGITLAHILATVFPPDQTLLHVDGTASQEKANEHARRGARADDALKSLENIVECMEAKSRDGKKISRSKWRSSESQIKKSFRLTDDDRSQIVEGLRTRFRTCHCASETDLCIARRQDTVPPGLPDHITRRVVVTSDSDFIAHGLSQILRPLPHSHGYGLYHLEDVLKAFGFSSPFQLAALACISSNDYGKNVPGFGIKTNIKLIKNMSVDQNIDDMVQSYVSTVKRAGGNVSPDEFNDRVRIFHLRVDSVIESGKESHILGPLPAQALSTHASLEDQAPDPCLHVDLSSMDPTLVQGCNPRLLGALRRIQAVKAAQKLQRESRAGESYSSSNDNKPSNPFRPTFTTQKSILAGRHYDISSSKTHSPPGSNLIVKSQDRKNDATPTSGTKAKDSSQNDKVPSKAKAKGKSKKGLHNARSVHKAKASKAEPITDREKANAKAKTLRRVYQTRTISIGSIEGSMLRRRMELHRDEWRKEDEDLFAIANGKKLEGPTPQQAHALLKSRFEARKQTCRQEVNELSSRLNNTALVVDELQRRAFWTAQIFISSVLAAVPSLTVDEKKVKKNLLDGILDKPDFLVNACNMLYNGKTNAKNDATGFQVAVTSLVELTGLPPVKTIIPGFTVDKISRLSEIAMVSVRACLRSHYRNVQFSEHKADEESDIEFFFRQNEVERLYKDFPTASFSPRAIMTSEEGLLNALWSRNTKSILCEIVGASSETVKAATDRVITDKGILFSGLFSMGGYRHVGLQKDYQIPDEHLPDDDLLTNPITEATSEDTAIESSSKDMDIAMLEDTAVEGSSMDMDIAIPEDAKFAGSSQGSIEHVRSPRQLLRSVLVTDGQFVNLVVFDTRHLRPRRNSNAGNGAEDGHDQDMLDVLQSINDDMEVDDPFLPSQKADDRPTATTTMEPIESSASTQQRGRINWMQRSRELENVGTVLAKPEDCLEYKNATLIGIDPGVRYPITATKIDPFDNNKRHNVRISSAFLNRPYHLFCQQLEERKRQAGISQLESQIPTLSITTVQEYFIYLCTSSVPASMTVLDRITSFYRDRWYRWARWNMKRGQNGCLDLAIKRLLRMAGGTEGSKKKPTIKAIFGVGLAQFSGPNSKHTKLLRRFILKARALGYTVVGIHEYFTSAKCPRPTCDAFLSTLKNRSKYCQTCQVYLDRDAVGSENIAWVLNGHVQCQLRPSKFMPTPSPATPTRLSQAPLASCSRKHPLSDDVDFDEARRSRVSQYQ